MDFEKASRLKLRFGSDWGCLTAEDLWDLSLPQLNSIAKVISKDLKSAEEEDFLKEENKEDTVLKLKFEIVLYVLNTKKEEAQKRKDAAEKKAEKEKLLDILATKEDEELTKLSKEEIRKKIEELGK